MTCKIVTKIFARSFSYLGEKRKEVDKALNESIRSQAPQTDKVNDHAA